MSFICIVYCRQIYFFPCNSIPFTLGTKEGVEKHHVQQYDHYIKFWMYGVYCCYKLLEIAI